MNLFRQLFSRDRAPVRFVSGDLDELFVMTKVGGVRGFASVGDLVRCYQKNQHADNRMREAAALIAKCKGLADNASRMNTSG